MAVRFEVEYEEHRALRRDVYLEDDWAGFSQRLVYTKLQGVVSQETEIYKGNIYFIRRLILN
jgi:hypothetical protein